MATTNILSRAAVRPTVLLRHSGISFLKRAIATAPFQLPAPRNEPNLHFQKGSAELTKLEESLKKIRAQLPVQSHIVYDGVTQQVSKNWDQPLPAEHATIFTNYPVATKEQVSKSIELALAAKKDWQNTPFVDRAAIFLRAAELVATKSRYDLIAATMLGQGKNVWQGEIDAAAELADFFRLNCKYAAELLNRQPDRGSDGMWSRLDYRPLEGFIYAISPFNFTAIGGNLVSGPALLGNVVIWKPSPYNVYASYLVYKILLEAGLPPNVIQFVTGDASEITYVVLAHREFAGLNFTGSSDVFKSLYGKVGQNIANKQYRDYPCQLPFCLKIVVREGLVRSWKDEIYCLSPGDVGRVCFRGGVYSTSPPYARPHGVHNIQ